MIKSDDAMFYVGKFYGMLLFEIGYDQYEDVRRLLVDAGYSDVRLIKDYAGLDRVVTAVKAK